MKYKCIYYVTSNVSHMYVWAYCITSVCALISIKSEFMNDKIRMSKQKDLMWSVCSPVSALYQCHISRPLFSLFINSLIVSCVWSIELFWCHIYRLCSTLGSTATDRWTFQLQHMKYQTKQNYDIVRQRLHHAIIGSCHKSRLLFSCELSVWMKGVTD